MDDKPWIKSYPAGVRWDLSIEPMPVPQIIEDAAAAWPDNPALRFMGRRISYRELDALSNRAAKGLQQLGVGPTAGAACPRPITAPAGDGRVDPPLDPEARWMAHIVDPEPDHAQGADRRIVVRRVSARADGQR